MARDGYLIMDSDLHMMEPDDLWARYLDEPYRQNPPRFFGAHQAKLADSKDDKGNADNIMGMEIQGLAIPAHAGQTGATVSSRELRRRIKECFEKNKVQTAGPGRIYVMDQGTTKAS